MAEHPDGSIIVDTELDAEGFKKGSSELQRAIKSLNTKMESLGPTFQKALNGNKTAIASFNAKAASLESTIADIESKMQELSEIKIPTDTYQWLTDEIRKAENELAKLEEKQAKMQSTGVKENSKAWQYLQYDINLAKQKISEYKNEQSNMRSNGTAFQSGINTGQYAQLERALTSAKTKLSEMQSQADSASNSTSRFASAGHAVKNAFGKIGSVGKKAFSGCVNLIKSGISKMRQFASSSKGSENAISKLGKKITGLGSMLKRAALRKIISGILTSVKDGINNLAQYSSQTNSDLSTLKSGLTQLKNSFATAFAPILTAVTPILAKLISYVSTAITYIGKLFAALSGAKSFTKATAVQEDYAASLDNTSSSAENAKKQLASFDKMNVLEDKSSSSSSSGGASVSEMFEEVPIESQITDFVSDIKEAFKNGDYAGIGEIIGKGINTAVSKVRNFISWDNIGGVVTDVITGIADGFNSLIYTVDWFAIGDTFGQGFNTVINTLYLLITEFDWPAVTAALAESLNGLVSGIDWAKLGLTLSKGAETLLLSIRSAITTFDWTSLGSSIAESINNIEWASLFSNLAGSISDILSGALDRIIGFAETLDWGKLGTDLWNSITGVLSSVDWSGICSKAFELLGSAVGGLATTIYEFCKTAWESIKDGFEKIKEKYFEKYTNELGEYTIEGFFKGVTDMLKDVGTWIKEHIFQPFMDGFKKAFGIHSPSTEMAEQGGYIISGLWQGIKDSWHSITEFFTEKLDGIKTTLSETWENIKTTASEKFTLIKGNISTAWNDVKTTASTKWSEIKTTLSDKWVELNTTASQKFESIKTTVSGKWSDIKSTASSKWDEIKSTLSKKADDIKSTLNGKDWSSIGSNICSGIKNGINDGWKWLKETVTTTANNLLSSAKSALGIHSPSKVFHDTIGLNIGYGIGEGIEDSQSSIIGTVSSVADAIAGEFENNSYSFGSVSAVTFSDSLTAFSDGITDSFSALINKLQAIAESVTFTVPAVATGTVIPKGTAKKYYSDTDTPTSPTDSVNSMKKAIAEVLSAKGDSGDINIVIELDGNVVYKTVVKKNKENTKRTGVNALVY